MKIEIASRLTVINAVKSLPFSSFDDADFSSVDDADDAFTLQVRKM